ncbi:MAG: radical SAM protein [Chloroflexi bacterium]|nr:radical SAM protein [Chloroflexota bacterium]
MGILRQATTDGAQLILNVRRESTVIMENDTRAYTFDAAGRLVGVFLDGKNYRRSLDNRILVKQSGARKGLAGRLRRMLTPAEVHELETRAYAFAREILARFATPLDAEFRDALAWIDTYDAARLERERVQFQTLYRPVSILPPDQYLALYLQATEGCSYNECSFCGLYRDRRFHAKSVAEFRQHIENVRAFFGDGISLRRTIFLGDANALMLPQARLVERFDAVNAAFEIMPRNLSGAARRAWADAHPIHFHGIYSFIDAFTTKRKSVQDFAALAERGLRRVYIGLESGDPALLEFLGKPNRPEDVIALVKHLKASGVAVGIIILIGAGGMEYQAGHIRETANLVNALGLDSNDLIYFSELVDYPGSTYAEYARQAGLHALSAQEMQAQQAQMRAGFVLGDAKHAPKISYYDLREFVY